MSKKHYHFHLTIEDDVLEVKKSSKLWIIFYPILFFMYSILAILDFILKTIALTFLMVFSLFVAWTDDELRIELTSFKKFTKEFELFTWLRSR